MRWSEIKDVRLKAGAIEGGVPTLYIKLVDGPALIKSRPPGSTVFGRLRARLRPWSEIAILPSLVDVEMDQLYASIELYRAVAESPSAGAG